MKLVMTHLGEVSPFELADGRHSVGGAPEDAVYIAPLPPSLLTLAVEADRLQVEAHQPVTIDGVLFPPGLPRLLLPGEVLLLPGDVTLARPPAEELPSGTASVFLRLLEAGEAPPPPEALRFTCLSGPDAGRVYVVTAARAVLGRAPDVEVRVRDRTVSRHHARVLREAGQLVLEDLGGPNGVHVGGVRVRKRMTLRDGDVVQLGRSLLRFNAPVSPPAPSGEAAPLAGARRRRRVLAWGVGAVLLMGGLLLALALLL